MRKEPLLMKGRVEIAELLLYLPRAADSGWAIRTSYTCALKVLALAVPQVLRIHTGTAIGAEIPPIWGP